MTEKFRYSLIAVTTAVVAAIASSCVSKETYVKTFTFPEGATPEQKVEMAANLVPTQKQIDWQNLELTAFLHFGVNTFTDREWGDGKESPEIFTPDSLDADQWVRTLKDAGFKMVILTAKHHDGFCLWPTATTSHSVASSPWRDGKGDVVADLRKACDKYGMKLGLYLSPWDRNAECYGDSPAYNDMFVAQLTELLTNYGRIDEVWFDGACGEGPNGKKQEYDWTRFRDVIETLQPEAVMAIMGDDVRWVGNEKGLGRETEWSVTALVPGIFPESAAVNDSLGLFAKAPDLGSRELIAKADKLYWWPSEVDVSIRPGWFYHDQEQPKSLRQLAEIYINSVGRNSVLLLNIPPDRRGLIADADVARLKEFREWIDSNFSDNKASQPEGFTVEIRDGAAVNAVVLGEDISRGQRVEEFTVEALVDGQWLPVTGGTTIGNKRILTFPLVAPEAMRLNIISSRGDVYLNRFETYAIEMPADVSVDLPGYAKAATDMWTIVDVSGDKQTSAAAFDGDPSTFWTSESSEGPKIITIDLGKARPLAGFVYEPREGDDKSGTVYHYTFELSNDGATWRTLPLSGEFSNIMHNPIPQKVYFPSVEGARYVRFTALDEIDARPYVTVAELSVLIPQ